MFSHEVYKTFSTFESEFVELRLINETGRATSRRRRPMDVDVVVGTLGCRCCGKKTIYFAQGCNPVRIKLHLRPKNCTPPLVSFFFSGTCTDTRAKRVRKVELRRRVHRQRRMRSETNGANCDGVAAPLRRLLGEGG